MADKKITQLTAQGSPSRSGYLVIVNSPSAGTPTTQYVLAGGVADLGSLSDRAQMSVLSTATTQTLMINTFSTFPYWGEDTQESGVLDAAKVSNAIITSGSGTFQIFLNLSFGGTGNSTYVVKVFANGVAINSAALVRKLGAGGDVGTASLGCIYSTSTPTTTFTIQVKDSTGGNFIVQRAQLMMYRIAV